MRIIINVFFLITWFWGGLLSQTFASAQTEIAPDKWDKPIRPELYENVDIFASGCQMVDSPYASGGAFTYGEQYIFVWHTQTEGLLYSINANLLLVPSAVTFHGDASEIPYTFESLGGMWSGLLFQDVFEFINSSEYEVLSEVTPKTLTEIAEKKICNVKYKNLERYIEWMGKDKSKQK